MTRRYFGTDGVRGVVGDDLTPDLVERIGKAATLWARRRPQSSSAATRAAPALSSSRRVARGIASAGGRRRPRRRAPDSRGRVSSPTSSASSSPRRTTRRSTTASSSSARAGQARRRAGGGDRGASRRPCGRRRSGRGADRLRRRPTSRTSSSRSARDLTGLRIGLDCANGAFSALASGVVRAARRRGARDRHRAGRLQHQRRLRRHRPACSCNDLVTSETLDLGIAFDGDGDRMLAVDERGDVVDGDQILAILALALGVDARRGHRDDEPRLPRAHGGARHSRSSRRRSATATCSRRCAAKAGSSAASNRATSSGSGTTSTGDGLAAALLLCRALDGSHAERMPPP